MRDISHSVSRAKSTTADTHVDVAGNPTAKSGTVSLENCSRDSMIGLF